MELQIRKCQEIQGEEDSAARDAADCAAESCCIVRSAVAAKEESAQLKVTHVRSRAEHTG